nr:hypothetical protein BaRGS_033537 [Batillaria attramentaria]
MSGYFPFHTGLQHGVIMPQQQAYLPGNLTTLPEALKTLGYAAHAVGKWHLGFCNWKYTPTYRGFDSFLGYYNAAEDYYTHHVGMVAILDEAIGNITSYLESTTYMDNLLIIFTTDNGGPVWDAGNNWPLRGAKATLWEGGTRGTGFIYSKTLINNKGTVHNGSGDWKLIQGSPASPAPYNGWYPVPGVDDAAQEDDYQPDDFQLYNIKSLPVSRLQLLRGRPLFLFPCGFHVKAWRVVLDAGFLRPNGASFQRIGRDWDEFDFGNVSYNGDLRGLSHVCFELSGIAQADNHQLDFEGRLICTCTYTT